MNKRLGGGTKPVIFYREKVTVCHKETRLYPHLLDARTVLHYLPSVSTQGSIL
ncbi:MAG: hypothetical protein QOJ99_4069 [Bryobacterales bacterium]|jgi:hypothetical protein|nr:hypothetical protein [Bryobacterales bacterium]